MNILIDIRPLMDERYSGVAEYTLELLQALFKLDSTNNYWLFYNSAKDISYRLPAFDYPNVKIIRTRWPNKIFNYAFLKLFRRPYFDRLIGEKIDIFFMPHFNFAAWSPRVQSILAVHDISFFHYPEFFSWRKNVWHRLLGVKSLLRRFSHIVALSENTKADIIHTNISSEKITTIYSGLSAVYKKIPQGDTVLQAVKQKYQLPDNFILFLGTVEPRKNIIGLIRAFEIVKKNKDSDLKFVIAGGRGWKANPVYKAARQSLHANEIIFLDYVPANEKVYLYNLASVFVYTSFYEGFGFPPLEAMASGTPTIVSAVSSLPEVVEDGAIMVDPYNPTSIAIALQEVIQNESLRSHLIARGQARAESFRWKYTAKQYLDLFTGVLKKNKP